MTPSPEKPLNPRQAGFLEALLTCPTIKQAAAKVGVTDRTCFKWMRDDPSFKAAFREAKANALAQAAAVLAHTSTTAVDVLLAVASNGAAPSSARVAAAAKLLDVAFRAAETELVLERLERCEMLLALTRSTGDKWKSEA